MSLKHDKQGFLTGEPIKVDSDAFSEAVSIWQEIRSDTAAIRKAIYRQVETKIRPTSTNGTAANQPIFKPKRAAPATPRDAQGRFIKVPTPAAPVPPSSAATPLRSTDINKVVSATVEAVEAATPSHSVKPKRSSAIPLRAPNGRFLTKQEKAGLADGTLNYDSLPATAHPKPRPENESNDEHFSDSGSSVSIGARGAISEFGQGVVNAADGVDPMVAAAREFSSIVTPIATPLVGLGKRALGFDGEKESIPWYRRIWGELRTMNKREENESKGGGGILGLLGSILLGILAFPSKLGKALLGLGGGGFGAIGTVARMLGKLALPITAMFTAVQAFNTSTEEYAKRLGVELDGSLSQELAVRFVGVLGDLGNNLTFGLAGKFGEYLAKVDWAGIGKSIKDTWADAIKGIKEFFAPLIDKAKELTKPIVDKTKEAAKETVKAVKEAGKAANDYVKEKTGVDVAGTAKTGYEKAKEVAGEGVEATKAAAKRVKNWVLGQTSKFFESGNSGAATVSSGKGDHGGASYGTYQMSSKMGVVQDFLKNSKYAKEFDGLKAGSPEFNRRWKEIAENDPEFGNMQHDFIKKTHFDPQMAKLKKGGIDLSKRGEAVQDAVWSTSVQFGGNSGLIGKALAGKDISKMSDAELVSAIQDYKAKNNNALFAKSSDKVRAGTLARAEKEKESLIKLASLGSAASSMPPSIPSVATTPPTVNAKIPAAPTEVISVASNRGGNSTTLVSQPSQAGQNINDRALAQIATGGMGSYMGNRA